MADSETPNATALLRNITSGDPQKIWSASSAIIHRDDRQTLEALAAQIPAIRKATQNIELGGMLLPNSVHLNFAIRKLEYVRDGKGCLCHLYPEYLFYDPNREEKQGNIHIRDVVTIQDKWIDYYTAECTRCKTMFQVEERESHYTWWGWKIVADKKERTRLFETTQ